MGRGFEVTEGNVVVGYGLWEIATDMKYRRLAQRSCVGSVWIPENSVPGVVVEVSAANVGA